MTRARPLGDTPAAEEIDAALEDAQALFLTLTARALTDVLISADYTAGEDERITDTSGSAVVTKPTTITTDCEPRPPRNGAIIEVTGFFPQRYIYISELKAWVQLDGLTLNSDQPFGPTLEEAVAAMIAARISGSVLQRDPPDEVIQLATQGRSAFDARFFQPIAAAVDPALRARPYWYNPITGLSS